MSFTKAMIEYFGKKDGETIQEFGAELRALTPADKLEFHAALRAMKWDVDAPTVVQ